MGGRDAVWREGDAGGGREGLPAEHHLPPRAQLHTTGQAVQPLRSDVPHPHSVTKKPTSARTSLLWTACKRHTSARTNFAPVRRAWNGAWVRAGRSYRTYKRAVVGLVEPFYYPMMPEDMSEADRETREGSLDELYHTRGGKDLLKVELLRLTRKNSPGWVWHGDFTTRRGTILKKIVEQRALREQFIQATKERMQEAREQ